MQLKLQPETLANFLKTPTNGLLDSLLDVSKFMLVFDHPIQSVPCIPSPERQVLRSKLIREEYIEFQTAWDKCAKLRQQFHSSPQLLRLCKYAEAIDASMFVNQDEFLEALSELADALADLVYVINGCALEYGIPLNLVWTIVQQANMSKVWATPPEPLPPGWRITEVPTGFVIHDHLGKVRKPPNWTPPDIKGILQQANSLP